LFFPTKALNNNTNNNNPTQKTKKHTQNNVKPTNRVSIVK